MFHFPHLTSLFRSPKRNFAHRRLFLPAWPSRPSTPDEAKAIVTVWNPKRDQLTCPNITGQLAVSSPAPRTKTSLLMARPTKVTQTRADLPTPPETGHVNKRLSSGGTVCLQGGQSYASGAASHWPTCSAGGSGCHAEGHLRGRSTFLYATRLLVALWLTFGPRSQAFHSIFVISTAGHCSFRAALGWHCGNQILGQHTGVEGIGCIFQPEGKDERFAITWKVGEKVCGFKRFLSFTMAQKKKKHFHLPSKLKRYQ